MPIHLDLWQVITTHYGPYAFGLVSLLVLWFAILKPELESQKLDFQAYQNLLTTQKQVVTSMQATARSAELTAATLERTVNKLEKLESSR